MLFKKSTSREIEIDLKVKNSSMMILHIPIELIKNIVEKKHS